jgi:uncharacterized membrane protein YcaP (DUF421 family)
MEIILRATAVYFFLWAVARGAGKRELAELSAFELILLVTMGDLIQQSVTQEDMSVTGAFLAVGTLAFWILVFAYLSFRFGRVRRGVEGTPVIVVRHGQPLKDVLRVERVTLDEVKEEARNQGIADLDDVAIGVLESDGRFSFLKRTADGDEPQGSPQRHRT